MTHIVVVYILVILALLTLGSAAAYAGSRPPKRWQRPLEISPPIDAEVIMERLHDDILRSPARTRGFVDACGVRVAAYWVVAVEVHPSKPVRWSSGFWSLAIDGESAPYPTLEALYDAGLQRLRVLEQRRVERVLAVRQ